MLFFHDPISLGPLGPGTVPAAGLQQIDIIVYQNCFKIAF